MSSFVGAGKARAAARHVRAQVMLSLSTDFENYKTFKPQPQHEQALNAMLDQLVAWAGAFKAMREGRQPMKQAA